MEENMMDLDYLERPLIPDVSYLISADEVKISSPGTIHAHAKAVYPIARADIDRLYKSVISTAKKNGVKVGYSRHIKSAISDTWAQYDKELVEYSAVFEALKNQALVVKNRGLHIGYCDDVEKEKLNAISADIQRYGYRTSAISKIREIYHDLLELLNGMDSGFFRYDKIYL